MKHAREDYNRIQDPSGKIPDDEPVFLLRAQDACAPDIVMEWCEHARDIGVDQQMIDMAYEHAQKMKQWQIDHGCKTPDVNTIRNKE